ncbi:MAG: Cof-type HAD-IIB family hydrolase [Syntrophomonadaceae bacterium]
MAIKLVALDLDDTLLDPDLQISEICMQAIRQVKEKGIIVTISTGRMYSSARPYAMQLGLSVPLITYEGALVKHSHTGEVLYAQPVPTHLAREVMTYFKTAGIHFHSYYDDRLVMERLTREGQAYARLAGVDLVIMPDLRSALDTNQAMKIMAISDQETSLLRMEQELRERYGAKLHITRSKRHFLEVMHPEADKSRALQVMAEHFGIERQEVMAIGDSYNDVEMIAWAGIGIAMANAFPVVKQKADFITSSNQEDGVAFALQRFILDKEQGSGQSA